MCLCGMILIKYIQVKVTCYFWEKSWWKKGGETVKAMHHLWNSEKLAVCESDGGKRLHNIFFLPSVDETGLKRFLFYKHIYAMY
ncbi:hypothetical protein BRADI_3g56177v3 [Brachypodium distachyon]|uniref:Uncharacterized protein n=1 Tax=Brachypodium distachyon TaxID=15368 RepID=A0A2K2D5B6_BRADI|nr:hypothetical protein BRADI_3g56177v3 [Brachypodium distachyon]